MRSNLFSKSRIDTLLYGVLLTTFLATTLFSVNGFANPHTTILKKNNPVDFSVRDELEGSSSIINHIRIPHGCNGSAITAMGVVFPNGDVDAVRMDTGDEIDPSDHINGNAISGAKPVQNHNIFRRIRYREAADPNSPGNNNVRAFQFRTGWLDPGLIGLIAFNANFPSFKEESCAKKLRVNIAIANYCTKSQVGDDRADIWIGHFTPKFDDPVLVVQSPPGFWPHLNVIRDLENNPLPDGCGEGYEIAVSPSSSDIDEYLPIPQYWPAN